MKHKYKKLIFIILATIITMFLALEYSNNNNRESMIVNFLDVGQGDSAVIRLPGNYRLLIDTGRGADLLSKLSEYLPFYDMSLDYVILTHPDGDHVGAYEKLSHKAMIKNLILSDISDFTNILKYSNNNINILNMKASSTIKIQENINETLRIRNNSVYKEHMSENSNSIVTQIEYNGFEFIFTGDIDVESERILVSRGYFNKNTIKILKVAHHGSKTSSSEYFLKSLKPEYCIISAGLNNVYNHPDIDVVERLNKYCKNVYSTISDGDIEFSINKGAISIKTKK